MEGTCGTATKDYTALGRLEQDLATAELKVTYRPTA